MNELTKEDEMIAELKNITELLTPKPAPVPVTPENFFQEFKQFLSNYKVLGLAVAFILGVYLGELVKALVNDLIMPIIGMILPAGEKWDTFVLFDTLLVGHFIGQLITFIIVAFVIFLLVKYSKRLGIQ